MKRLQLFFLPLLFALGCVHENITPETARVIRLQSEEYFDTTGGGGGFVAVFKNIYHYDKNRLVSVDAYDFNPHTQTYDSGYRFEEYQYTNEGKLSQYIQFAAGLSTVKWIDMYEYPNATSTKVTEFVIYNNDTIDFRNWWTMDKTPSSLTVKYYQGNSDKEYAQLTYAIDGKGNVISVTGDPSFPLGKIYYEYDKSPNPYKFPELSGEYGIDSERYLSENNIVTVANDSENKSPRVIEYNDDGYPVTITTSTFKKKLTYR